MPSPFPGMDPYLERDALWPDFHNAFCLRFRAALNRVLPAGYVARVEERLIVEADDALGQRVGDVTISDLGRPLVSSPQEERAGGSTVLVEIPPVADALREVYLEIRDRTSGDLVTLIEMLSPTNKRPSSHRSEFLQKREEVFSASINYVEVDFLREPPRLPLTGLPDCDYYVLIREASRQRQASVHAIRVTQHLPAIVVPLRHGEHVVIALQDIFDETFEEGRYAPQIYQTAPTLPLTDEQRQWAESLIAESNV